MATGRNTDAVSTAVGQADDLLVVKLDVTSAADAEAAVKAAVDRFSRIDVLVNNAANFFGGFFEELTPVQIERQLVTGLIGPMNVTTTIVNPGMFRTELLTEASATYATPSITDYRERGAAQQRGYEAQNGRQAGDPAKLAQALLTIADQQPPPRRFIAGADAVAIAEQKVRDLQEQVNAYRDLSTSLAWEEA